VMATDNVELACAFIQKTAVEKAIPEMDKRLATVCSFGTVSYQIIH
jgi:CCR4-NOT transcription complex subunit 1